MAWKDSRVALVFECTGEFRTPELLDPYFGAGVGKVFVAAPVKGKALSIVMGVNDRLYQPDEHHLLTAASCTTKCLAPVVKVIHEGIGTRHGGISRLSYTPVELAFLFLFYELFGVVTNLLGGWIAARMGLKTTLTSGLALQVGARTQRAGPRDPARDRDRRHRARRCRRLSTRAGNPRRHRGVRRRNRRELLGPLVPDPRADGDQVAMNVGFYYMSNAAGRLIGTLVSGLMFQAAGLRGCLWASTVFALAAAALSMALPRKESLARMDAMKAEGGSSD